MQRSGGATLWLWAAMVAGLIVVAAMPGTADDHPHFEKNEWHGMVGCGVMYPAAFQPITCPHPENDRRLTFEAEPGLKTLAVAMHWDIVPTNLGGALRHYFYVGESGPMGQGAVARFDSPPPMYYRVDATPGNPLLDWDAATEPFELNFRVWAGSGDLSSNVVLEQPFRVYYHLFYGEHAPDGYFAQP